VKRPTKRRLGLHVGETRWVVHEAELGRAGLLRPGRKGVFDLPAEPERVGSDFRAFLRDTGFSGTSAVASFPQHRTVTRLLTLPSRSRDEIQSMAALQAGRLLPLPWEELAFGCESLGPSEDGGTRVALSVVPRRDLDTLMAACSAAGVTLEAVVPDCLVVRPFIEKENPFNGVVVRAGNEEGQIACWDDVGLISLRGFPLEATPEGLSTQVVHTVRAQRDRRTGWTPARFLWLGRPPAPSLLGSLGEDHGMTFHIATLTAPFSVEKADHETEEDFSARAAAGVDLQTACNLLPELEKQKIRRVAHRRQKKIAFGLTLALGMLLMMGGWASLRKKSAFLSAQEAAASALEARTADLSRMESQLARRRSAGPGVVALLDDLEKTLPDRVSINSLIFEKGETLRIRGEASSLKEALGVVERLKTSRVFGKVELKGTDRSVSNGREVGQFNVVAELARKKRGQP